MSGFQPGTTTTPATLLCIRGLGCRSSLCRQVGVETLLPAKFEKVCAAQLDSGFFGCRRFGAFLGGGKRGRNCESPASGRKSEAGGGTRKGTIQSWACRWGRRGHMREQPDRAPFFGLWRGGGSLAKLGSRRWEPGLSAVEGKRSPLPR